MQHESASIKTNEQVSPSPWMGKGEMHEWFSERLFVNPCSVPRKAFPTKLISHRRAHSTCIHIVVTCSESCCPLLCEMSYECVSNVTHLKTYAANVAAGETL